VSEAFTHLYNQPGQCFLDDKENQYFNRQSDVSSAEHNRKTSKDIQKSLEIIVILSPYSTMCYQFEISNI